MRPAANLVGHCRGLLSVRSVLIGRLTRLVGCRRRRLRRGGGDLRRSVRATLTNRAGISPGGRLA